MSEEVKRGPGRPSKNPLAKSGTTSWKPASLNDFQGKDDGYRYRMLRNDPENLAKKQAEQWEIVSGIQGHGVSYNDPEKIGDGKPLTSVVEGRDWVLARMPEDVAKERDEYMNKKAERQVAGLTAHVRKELGKGGAGMHGDITISSMKQ